MVDVIYSFLFGFGQLIKTPVFADPENEVLEEEGKANSPDSHMYRSDGKIKRKYYRTKERRKSISLMPDREGSVMARAVPFS
jgi:hypothetical protein